jgi:hypothetical protein
MWPGHMLMTVRPQPNSYRVEIEGPGSWMNAVHWSQHCPSFQPQLPSVSVGFQFNSTSLLPVLGGVGKVLRHRLVVPVQVPGHWLNTQYMSLTATAPHQE